MDLLAKATGDITSAEKCASVATSLNMVRVMAIAAARHVSENTTASRLALRVCSDVARLSSAGCSRGDISPSLRCHKFKRGDLWQR